MLYRDEFFTPATFILPYLLWHCSNCALTMGERKP